MNASTLPAGFSALDTPDAPGHVYLMFLRRGPDEAFAGTFTYVLDARRFARSLFPSEPTRAALAALTSHGGFLSDGEHEVRLSRVSWLDAVRQGHAAMLADGTLAVRDDVDPYEALNASRPALLRPLAPVPTDAAREAQERVTTGGIEAVHEMPEPVRAMDPVTADLLNAARVALRTLDAAPSHRTYNATRLLRSAIAKATGSAR